MKPTTREVIACLEQELAMWENGWNRDTHIIKCLRRAIAIVRASARVKASRKGRAKR